MPMLAALPPSLPVSSERESVIKVALAAEAAEAAAQAAVDAAEAVASAVEAAAARRASKDKRRQRLLAQSRPAGNGRAPDRRVRRQGRPVPRRHAADAEGSAGGAVPTSPNRFRYGKFGERLYASGSDADDDDEAGEALWASAFRATAASGSPLQTASGQDPLEIAADALLD